MKAGFCWKMLAVAAGLAITAVQVHSQTTNLVYAFTDLGSLGEGEAEAYGINNLGQIVGQSEVPGTPPQPHAFLYSGGVMTDLGTLGGGEIPNSSALAINNEGQIVGYSTVSNGEPGTVHAFLYQNGIMSDLGALGTNSSKAYAINDLGQIVGESDISPLPPEEPSMRAFLYSNGVMTNLGAPSGRGSEAFGINNSSWIVGDYVTNLTLPDTNSFGTNTAWLDIGGSISNLSETSGLGTLRACTAYAINNSGQVTGYAVNGAATERRAYLYSGGMMTDLGTLDAIHTNTQGLAINNLGQVVGTATTNTVDNGEYGMTNSGRAFIWNGASMIDLNTVTTPPSGWTLQAATGINDYGQIVGYAWSFPDIEHAFLLTPMPTLTITATAANGVTISWPANGPNFTLTQSTSAAGTNWTAVTNVPTTTNGMNTVMVPADGGMQFFRLMFAQ